MAVPEYPALVDGDVMLRMLRQRDTRVLEQVLLANRAWLSPWEATLPGGGTWNVRGSVRSLLDQAAARTLVPWVIEFGGELIGQVTMSNIQYGAVLQGTVGYWVAQHVAGRGITPTAVALACDYGFRHLGLHRIEICIRPENTPSLRVVEKLGFRYEGRRARYIHIDGDWRDHYCFGLVRDEAPQGVLRRWREGAANEQNAQRPTTGPLA